VSVPGCFGDEKVCSVGLWGRQWFFFWVGGIGDGKSSRRGPWSSSYHIFGGDQNLARAIYPNITGAS
jgi:hypothetical protein